MTRDEFETQRHQMRCQHCGHEGLDKVYNANNNGVRPLCPACGSRTRIGLTAQHVVPFVEGGADWPLIPFCARCQQASVAALAETKRVASVVGDLDAVIRRIEAAHPELLR